MVFVATKTSQHCDNYTVVAACGVVAMQGEMALINVITRQRRHQTRGLSGSKISKKRKKEKKEKKYEF